MTVMLRSRPICSNRATASRRCWEPRLRPSSSRISSSGRSRAAGERGGADQLHRLLVHLGGVALDVERGERAALRTPPLRRDRPAPRLVGLGRRVGLGELELRAVAAVLLIEPVELLRHQAQPRLDAVGKRCAVGAGGAFGLAEPFAGALEGGVPLGALAGDLLLLEAVERLVLREVTAQRPLQRRAPGRRARRACRSSSRPGRSGSPRARSGSPRASGRSGSSGG